MISPRRLGSIVLASALRFCLFAGLSSLALVLVFGNKQTVKEALIDSNAYNRFTQGTIDKIITSNQSGTIPFRDPQVQKVVNESFDASTIQMSSEAFIDSTYSWLEGNSSNLTFKIDLTENKQQLASGLATYAVDRLIGLPPCTSLPSSTDAFSLECRPPFIDYAQASAAVSQGVFASQDFLPNPVLTEADLPKTRDGTPFAAAYANVPDYFQWFKILPWVMLAASAIIAGLMVWLENLKRKAIKRIGNSLISTGIVLLFAPLIYVFLTDDFYAQLRGATNDDVAGIINDVSLAMYATLNSYLINIAIQAIVIGIIARIALYYTRPPITFAEVQGAAGLSTSQGRHKLLPSDKKTHRNAPIQTSEGHRERKTSKLNKKYRKIRF